MSDTGASPSAADRLFALIEHGDENHRQWLREKVDEFYTTYQPPEHGWTCFHCDETFTTAEAARDHFGINESMEPACRVTGDVAELRRLQTECTNLRADLEYETSSTQAFNARLASDLRGHAPFRNCRSVHDAFNVYDSMEGEAIAAKERAEKAEGLLRCFMEDHAVQDMSDETYTAIEKRARELWHVVEQREGLKRENARLSGLLNTPEVHDFTAAVTREAAHQVERWGVDHDIGKEPMDWFWLVGYLAGKCVAAHIAGNIDKALHHTISTAAALANWHTRIKHGGGRMQPGHAPSVALVEG